MKLNDFTKSVRHKYFQLDANPKQDYYGSLKSVVFFSILL